MGFATEAEREPIPLSALQHAVYCLRQAALIHLEHLWEDNRFTAEGQVLHVTVDKPGTRHARGVRRVTALPLASRRHNLTGVADLVEFRREGGREIPFPVDYKRGNPKLHRTDEVQLCAQALCLEEMTGEAVPAGALFYAQTKRRLEVHFDETLRAETVMAIEAMGQLFASRNTPPPTVKKERCRGCSLHDLCRPEIVSKPVRAWRRRMVENQLDGDGSAPE